MSLAVWTFCVLILSVVRKLNRAQNLQDLSIEQMEKILKSQEKLKEDAASLLKNFQRLEHPLNKVYYFLEKYKDDHTQNQEQEQTQHREEQLKM